MTDKKVFGLASFAFISIVLTVNLMPFHYLLVSNVTNEVAGSSNLSIGLISAFEYNLNSSNSHIVVWRAFNYNSYASANETYAFLSSASPQGGEVGATNSVLHSLLNFSKLEGYRSVSMKVGVGGGAMTVLLNQTVYQLNVLGSNVSYASMANDFNSDIKGVQSPTSPQNETGNNTLMYALLHPNDIDYVIIAVIVFAMLLIVFYWKSKRRKRDMQLVPEQPVPVQQVQGQSVPEQPLDLNRTE